MKKDEKKPHPYGIRLKKVRKSLGLTQESLAKEIGLNSKQTISDIETGKQLRLGAENELLLHEKFGVSRKYLEHGDGEDRGVEQSGTYNNMIIGDSNRSSIHEPASGYGRISTEIASILEVLEDMDTQQRRAVLRYALSVEAGES